MSVKKVVLPDGEIRWEIYTRATGQGDRRVRRRFEKKIDALNFLHEFENRKREILGDSQQKVTTDFEATTFDREAEYWLTMKSSEFSKGYFRVINPGLKLIKRLYGHYSIAKFTPGLLHEFRLLLRSKGLTPATQNRYADIINRVIAFSFAQKRINQNPTIGYQKLKEPNDGVSFWNEDEVAGFLSFANKKYPIDSDKRWIYIAYLFALETGVRARELWGIRLMDLPNAGTKLKISKQHSGGNKFVTTKGKDARYVPFSSGLKIEVDSILIARSALNPNQTIFVSENGTPIDHDNFTERVFRKDIEQCRIRTIRFHDLRHTALTLMVKKGISLPIIQKIAGHKDIKTTMRYVHVLGQDIEDIGSALSLST